MKDYQTFIFDSYSFDEEKGEISLKYSLDGEVEFEEILNISKSEIRNPREARNPNIEAALFILHIIGGTSYYKTCIPKKIDVRSGELNETQAQFFTAVYENGLGEFFYRNEIDFRGLINFPVSNLTNSPSPVPSPKSQVRTLVPIGGGKDSIVTIEKLKNDGADITLLRMGGHPLIDEVVKLTGLPCITIERQLSPTLFELNEQGALNGHIPITAYLSALCVVVAELFGFDSIALSNEKSASYGNVEYLGKEINHQWSKSEEFEIAFQNYISNNIDPELHYYSALRDMTELEVVGKFIKYPQYFENFTSCNKNWKISSHSSAGMPARRNEENNRWCRTCPKCAFAFTLLAAYLPPDELEKIFGGNVYEDASLEPLYKQLLGLEGFKPFECVGTPEETREAFEMASGYDETPIMKIIDSNS